MICYRSECNFWVQEDWSRILHLLWWSVQQLHSPVQHLSSIKPHHFHDLWASLTSQSPPDYLPPQSCNWLSLVACLKYFSCVKFFFFTLCLPVNASLLAAGVGTATSPYFLLQRSRLKQVPASPLPAQPPAFPLLPRSITQLQLVDSENLRAQSPFKFTRSCIQSGIF